MNFLCRVISHVNFLTCVNNIYIVSVWKAAVKRNVNFAHAHKNHVEIHSEGLDFHCRVILQYVRVNEIKTMYRRSRVYVKVEPFGLSYIASISFTQVNFFARSQGKISPQWKTTQRMKYSALTVPSYVVDKWPLTQFCL